MICTDSTAYPSYTAQAGNCTGAGISSAFVNYVTGDYQITFASAPASGAVITASWTSINPPVPTTAAVNVYNNLSYVGTGRETSGFLSSVYARTPGGSSGHVLAGCITDDTTMWETGYPTGAAGYSQMIDWFYGVRIPSLFTGSASTPLHERNDAAHLGE